MPLRTTSTRIAAAAALVLAAVIPLSALPASAATTAAAPVTYTYAGDSVTQANNTWSWTKYVDTAKARSVGGVATAGATSATIAAAAKPVDADVLVVMIGVDDVRFGVTPTAVRTNVLRIVQKVGADHVVIAANPPCDLTDYGSQHIDRRAKGVALNASLQSYAALKHWDWVDPFSSVRKSDNGWRAGASFKDGVHPAESTAKQYLGPRMTTAIVRAAA